jgi:hypothetical protein
MRVLRRTPELTGEFSLLTGGCHAVGLKPGILSTKHGDYGMRDAIKGKFEELRLGPHGLCNRCAEETRAK